MQLTFLIIGIILTAAIVFVIWVISDTNGSGYELYAFLINGRNEHYELTMFNNKTQEWSVTLNIEQYIKLSSVFSMSRIDGNKPFQTCEYYSYLRCDKTTASKIRFYIDRII